MANTTGQKILKLVDDYEIAWEALRKGGVDTPEKQAAVDRLRAELREAVDALAGL